MKLRSFCDANVNDSLSEKEWSSVIDIINILGPFNKYSKKLQSKTVTLSDFFGYWTLLRIKTSKANDELSVKLLAQMDNYHRTLMKNPTVIGAAYLDPRYQRGLGPEKSMAVTYLTDLYLRILEVESYDDKSNTVETNGEINNNTDESYEELAEYLNAVDTNYHGNRTNELSNTEKDKILAILNDFNGKVSLLFSESILNFWEANKFTYPELYKLASVVMAMPPTQTTVERIFSALALVLTSHRTRLGDKMLEDILLVRLNTDLLTMRNAQGELHSEE